jgi:hypothetical protein
MILNTDRLSKNGVNSERERRPKKKIIIAIKFVKNEKIIIIP